MELTSGNIEEIKEISNSLLEFKDFDETLLSKGDCKITELTAIKETANKNYNFKTVRDSREEAHLLKEYLKKNKRHLAK